MASKSSADFIQSEFVHITPEHEIELCTKLYQQWQESRHCDLVISLRGGELRAHSCVLAAFSPKLKVLLENSAQYSQAAGGMFIQLTFEDRVFQCLLNMMYTGVLSFNTTMLSSVMSTARWMQMDEVVRLCQEYKEAMGSSNDDALLTDDVVLCEVSADDMREEQTIFLPEIENHEKEPEANVCPKRKGRKRGNPDKMTSKANCRKKKKDDTENTVVIKTEIEVEDSTPAGFVEMIENNAFLVEQINSPNPDISVDAITQTPIQARASPRRKCKKSEPKETRHGLRKIVKGNPSAPKVTEIKTERQSPEKEADSSLVSQVQWVEAQNIDRHEYNQEATDFAMGKSDHIKCKKCLLKFTELNKYFAHITDHPIFTCNKCATVYYRQSNLTRHLRVNHSSEHYLCCKKCDFLAHSEKILRTHFKEVHGDDKPFICDYPDCTYSTWKQDFLKRHAEIHSEVKRYICNKCGQGFSQHAGLVSHEHSCYHLQQYLCDLCGQAFNHLQSMRAHRRTIHFGEKPYLCKVCGNQFSDQRNLKRHMRIHENTFPYHCPICRQQYRHSNSLKTHLKKHGDAALNLNLAGIINQQSAQRKKKTGKNGRAGAQQKAVEDGESGSQVENALPSDTEPSVDSASDVVFPGQLASEKSPPVTKKNSAKKCDKTPVVTLKSNSNTPDETEGAEEVVQNMPDTAPSTTDSDLFTSSL